MTNKAASKLSAEAEESLKSASDKKESATAFSHAIVAGHTHPLADPVFIAK